MLSFSKTLSAFVVLLVLDGAIVAQSVSKKYCRKIETTVVTPLRPTSIDHRIVFSNQCWLDFTAPGKVDVLLTVDKHKSAERSHDSIQTYLLMVAVGSGLETEKDLRFDKFDTDHSWDEVYFMKPTLTNSGVLLLRKDNVEVNILSHSTEIIVRMEKTLRTLVASKLL
jgi:hypothetical protein